MRVLFVLVPEDDVDSLLDAAFGPDAAQRPVLRRYPRATDERHLLSLVRAGRDRHATTWGRGAVKAVALGAVLGAITNGVLAAFFGMLGGMVGVACGLGLVLGAFLGGFTAMMTGTEVARPELRALLRHTRDGDVLLQLVGDDREAIDRLLESGEARGLHALRIT
ncbi:MAG: hypothetical protein H6835_14605 [Planctomycetes bacterium]|nr:hypothetical protein [Planctomycetota bacterium]